MELRIPDFGVVLLVGASGSGKSSFARKHFLPSEILSSDTARGWVCDDENSLDANNDAFEVLHFMLRKRLKNRRLTVIDATNVQEHARRALVQIANEYHALTSAIVFNIDPRICQERNALRPDRQFGEHVVRNHTRDLRRSLASMDRKEGIRYMHVLRSVEEVDSAQIVRDPLWTDRRTEAGPFDIIGDIHGCFSELAELLARLGYQIEEQPVEPIDEREKTRFWEEMNWFRVENPEGRKAIFLGDLVDRGPDSPRVLKLVMSMVANGQALCVPGNHDDKLFRKLSGKDVRVTHGLAETLEQLEAETPEFREQAKKFLGSLVSHYWLDGGSLTVAHAGLKEEMQGRSSGRARDFCLYGETTGETDEFGLPVRYNWAAEYRGKSKVVYGHTPVPEAEWLNRTINIDTGCVFGGKLTALRYPENELVSVPAKTVYAEPRKPFLDAPTLAAQHEHDDLLDLDDVLGRRAVHTGLRGNITVREENATAALEVMSRFASNPKWLVYLPPTMSPCETSLLEGYLEHPAEAFAYFQSQGVEKVVCEEKHMGSRAIVVVCRDPETALRRFGVTGEGRGAIYTRTGRRFFDSAVLEAEMLEIVANAFSQGLWDELQTDWAVLDCELMPWSAKAQELLKRQYAAVGSAATNAMEVAMSSLGKAADRGVDLGEIQGRFAQKQTLAGMFVDAYRRYCWSVESIRDYKLAPFHIMATEGRVHTDQAHLWHMGIAGKLAEADETGVLMQTRHRLVDLASPEQVSEATSWWVGMTNEGGEGMVVKPSEFITSGPKGVCQPAIKCRGSEYLRIIYGPEYSEPENLSRLRKRGLARKRSLAMAEFALGIEGLTRFVNKEPLRRVHECAFGVLAMESEPVDPRL